MCDIAYVSALDHLLIVWGHLCHPVVIWGNRGQISIVTKNALSPLFYIVNPCKLIHKHMHKLGTFYPIYGVKGQPWII